MSASTGASSDASIAGGCEADPIGNRAGHASSASHARTRAGRFVAVVAGDFPQVAIRPPFDLGDEAPASCADGGHDRGAAGEKDAHGGDEGRAETFHLADLVYQVDAGVRIGPEQRRRIAERRQVHAIFPDAVALREIDIGDNARRPAEADQPKAASFAGLADLLGIKAAQPSRLDPVGDTPNERGLADARPPGDQQNMRRTAAILRHPGRAAFSDRRARDDRPGGSALASGMRACSAGHNRWRCEG